MVVQMLTATNIYDLPVELVWESQPESLDLNGMYTLEPVENSEISTYRLQGDCSAAELNRHKNRQNISITIKSIFYRPSSYKTYNKYYYTTLTQG